MATGGEGASTETRTKGRLAEDRYGDNERRRKGDETDEARRKRLWGIGWG